MSKRAYLTLESWKLVRGIYGELLMRVSFFKGLPWFVTRPLVEGITLGENIYLVPDATVDVVVHELYHAVNQKMAAGVIPWFLRPAYFRYALLFVLNGFSYSRHPMEKAAREFATKNLTLQQSQIRALREG